MNKDYLIALVKLTSARSSKIIAATIEYMSGDCTITEAARAHNVDEPNISRLKNRIIDVEHTLCELRKISLAGKITPDYLEMLINLTKIPNRDTFLATSEHICHNVTSSAVATKYNVKQSAVLRMKSRLLSLNEAIKPLLIRNT